MSIFEERIKNQGLRAEIRELAKKLEAVARLNLEKDHDTIVRRTKRILEKLQTALSESDPEMITVSMLDNLKQPLSSLSEAIKTCQESGDWNVLIKRGDILLQHLANFLPPTLPDNLEKDYREALEEYRGLVASRLEESENNIQQFLNEVADAKSRIEKQSQEATETIEESKRTITALQDAIHQLEEARVNTENNLQDTREAVERLSEHAGNILSSIEKESQGRADKLRAEHEEWIKSQMARWSELQSQKDTTFSNRLNEWNTNFSNAENARQEQFTKQQSDRSNEFSTWKSENRATVEKLISDWEQTLTQSHKEQSKAADEFRKSQTERFEGLHKQISHQADDLLKQHHDDFESARTTETENSEAHLSSIRGLEMEARNLVGLIGNTAVTGNYQKTANQEHKTADIMRYLSLGSIGVVGFLAILIVWNVSAIDFNWEVALFRLLVGLPFIGLAIYCARESSRHRSNEERNRRIELELTALEPYLYQLPPEKAKEIREKLTEKYFGNGGTELSKAEGHRLVLNLRETLKQLDPFIDLIKRIAK